MGFVEENLFKRVGFPSKSGFSSCFGSVFFSKNQTPLCGQNLPRTYPAPAPAPAPRTPHPHLPPAPPPNVFFPYIGIRTTVPQSLVVLYCNNVCGTSCIHVYNTTVVGNQFM